MVKSVENKQALQAARAMNLYTYSSPSVSSMISCMPLTGSTVPDMEQYGHADGTLPVFGVNWYLQLEQTYFAMGLFSSLQNKNFAAAKFI